MSGTFQGRHPDRSIYPGTRLVSDTGCASFSRTDALAFRVDNLAEQSERQGCRWTSEPVCLPSWRAPSRMKLLRSEVRGLSEGDCIDIASELSGNRPGSESEILFLSSRFEHDSLFVRDD